MRREADRYIDRINITLCLRIFTDDLDLLLVYNAHSELLCMHILCLKDRVNVDLFVLRLLPIDQPTTYCEGVASRLQP